MKIANKDQYMSRVLLDVYDSANWLYNDERWLGSDDTFLPLLAENEFLFALDGAKIMGFLSYQPMCQGSIKLTSLYVAKDCQNKGVASCLMDELKSSMTGISIIACVINNATWARNFYEKHGFALLAKDWRIPDEMQQFIRHEEWSCLYARFGDAGA